MDYRRLYQPVYAFAPLGIVTAMLVVVYFADPRRHRWINIAALGSIQPSEFAKPALIIFLAWFITVRLRAINHVKTLGPALLASGALGLTVIVADLGTALVLISTVFVLFFIAGVEKRLLFGAATIGVLVLFAAVAAKPYRLAQTRGQVRSRIQTRRQNQPEWQFPALHPKLTDDARPCAIRRGSPELPSVPAEFLESGSRRGNRNSSTCRKPILISSTP